MLFPELFSEFAGAFVEHFGVPSGLNTHFVPFAQAKSHLIHFGPVLNILHELPVGHVKSHGGGGHSSPG